jgi:radical SAM protein with 4Fe4S-binding SPASM domain
MTNRLQLSRKILLAKKYPKTALRLLIDRFVDKFKLHKETSPAPNLVVLHVSETCNLRCPMCLIWESRNKFGEIEKRNAALSFDDIENIVKQVESFKPMFYLVGGEPTLNRDLITIINYIHKKGMITSLTTNGWLLADFAQSLFDSGLDFISISIDASSASIHDKNRGVSGSFERSIEGIKRLVEIKKQNHSIFPNIKINTVVTPWNVDELENTIILAKNLGADELSFENFSFFGKKIQELNNSYIAAKKTGEIIMGMQVEDKTPFCETSIKKITQFLKSLSELSKKYNLSLLNIPYTNNHEEFYKGTFPLTTSSWCYSPWHTATIRGSGDFEVCQGYVVGNIKENKLMDLWNNEKYRHFRKIIKTEHITPACYRCCNLNSCFLKK